MLFEPLDFIARLVALVPKPRVNLTRFHGVFAPNSKQRAEVTPNNKQSKSVPQSMLDNNVEEKIDKNKRNSMTWAQRLKRVFGIDIEMCDQCGGVVKVIACIDDPVVIEKNTQPFGQ